MKHLLIKKVIWQLRFGYAQCFLAVFRCNAVLLMNLILNDRLHFFQFYTHILDLLLINICHISCHFFVLLVLLWWLVYLEWKRQWTTIPMTNPVSLIVLCVINFPQFPIRYSAWHYNYNFNACMSNIIISFLGLGQVW